MKPIWFHIVVIQYLLNTDFFILFMLSCLHNVIIFNKAKVFYNRLIIVYIINTNADKMHISYSHSN